MNKEEYKKALYEYFVTEKGLDAEAFKCKPSIIENLKEMATAIINAVNKKLRICIVGDYDCDGITSSSILYKILKFLGANVTVRLPKRFSEGYGLSIKIIEEIKDECDVIITVDNGIAAIESIEYAKALNKTVYIIDHHEPKVIDNNIVLPKADLIVDHKISSIPCKTDYCGAGLSFRLVEEIKEIVNIPDALVNECLVLSCLGTIADVVDVHYDNRRIIINGLEYMNTKKHLPVGIEALLQLSYLNHLDSDTVGFRITPVLNAPGRLYDDGAMLSFKLCTLEDYNDAYTLAENLIGVNNHRKELTKQALDTCESIIAENCLYGDIPLLVVVPDVCEGIVGIVAGKLCEKYQVPAGVFTNTENGIYKGSFRSSGYDIKQILDNANSYIYKYGGHTGAAGCSVKSENWYKFYNEVQVLDKSPYEIEEQIQKTEFIISGNDVLDFYTEQCKYGPFGQNNKVPVITVKDIELQPVNGKHYSYNGNDNENVVLHNKDFRVVGFGMADMYNNMNYPTKVEVTGIFNMSYFKQYKNLQILADEIKGIIENKKMTSLADELRKRMLAI